MLSHTRNRQSCRIKFTEAFEDEAEAAKAKRRRSEDEAKAKRRTSQTQSQTHSDSRHAADENVKSSATNRS